MYLSKRIYLGMSYEHNQERLQDEDKIVIEGKQYPIKGLSQLEYQVAYWRKANQIHNWFVVNCQGGQDDCKEYFVDKGELGTLVDLCKEVLANREKAEELLPTSPGFFFGSYDYDDQYFFELEDTIEQLTPLLEENGVDFIYQSSW